MRQAAGYSVTEQLRDGRGIEIRALHPEDRDEMLVAIGRTSTQSLRRRFFAPKPQKNVVTISGPCATFQGFRNRLCEA